MKGSVKYEIQKANAEHLEAVRKAKTEIVNLKARDENLDLLFKRLYEDSVLGRIPDEQYRVLSQEYMAEQKSIDEELPKLSDYLQKLKDSSTNIDRFLENARKYTEIRELTSEILHTFIERIEVGEREERYSRTAAQEIRIIYRDIGLIDEMPETMLAQAEEKAEIQTISA